MKQKKKQHKNKANKQPTANVMQGTISIPNPELKATAEKEYKYALPIAEIKKDLIKTAAFAVFAVGVILALNYFMPETGLKLDLSRYKFF